MAVLILILMDDLVDVDRSAGRNRLFVVALGVPAVQGDRRGDRQAADSLAVAGGTTNLPKKLVYERCPDGSDNRSVPSGHISISFAAGLRWRSAMTEKLASQLAVASFVSVEADKHYGHDVVAGAAIGTLGGLLLTTRHDDRVTLTPCSAHGGGGLDLAVRF